MARAKGNPKFGERLTQHRNRSAEADGRRVSQERLAQLLSERLAREVDIDRNDVGRWERGQTPIDPNDRELLVAIIAILYACKGIFSQAEADKFLQLGHYAPLEAGEVRQIDPGWLAPTLTSTPTNDPLLRTGVPFMPPPLPPQGVVGRKDALDELVGRMALSGGVEWPEKPLALWGMGGIGKTTLVATLSHARSIWNYFPDGVLWAALGPKPTLRRLLNQWGDVLGQDLRPESDEESCRQRLQSAAQGLRLLIIVDDVWDVNHAKHLQIAGPLSRLVITTREPRIAHFFSPHELIMQVDALKPDAALELLAKLAPRVVQTDEVASKRLCARLDHLPLAITLAGRLLAAEPEVGDRPARLLAELVERREARLGLLQDEGRPGIDEDNPVSLQAILGMSVDRLSDLDRQRFAMLSNFGGEPLTWELDPVCAVWDCSREEAEATVSRLRQRSLVEPQGDRFSMHALLADYAEELRIAMNL